jgi:hypothetical protein
MVNSILNEHLEYIPNDYKTIRNLRKGQVKIIIDNANAVILNYKNYR